MTTRRTASFLERLGVSVTGWFRRDASGVAVDDLDPGSGRRLGIEPLEERIAPGTLVVNPPGQGGGTTGDLPDAADHGLERAADRSPAIEDESPLPPPGPPPTLRTV